MRTYLNVITTRKWVLPLFVGALLPLLYWAVFLRDDVSYGVSRVTLEQIARRDGMNVGDYTGSMKLLGKVDTERRISDRDWQRLVAWCNGKDAHIRGVALGTMACLYKSPHRNEVLSMVRPLLRSDKASDVTGALLVLWRFDDPSWRQEAMVLRSSPDSVIAEAANIVLSKGKPVERKRP